MTSECTIPAKPTRSEATASRIAFGALLLRDLTVLKKGLGIFFEFAVFLYMSCLHLAIAVNLVFFKSV